MKTLTVQIPATERRCEVDDDEMIAWSRALLDDLLFEAAKQVSDGTATAPVQATITFRVSPDERGEDIVIER